MRGTKSTKLNRKEAKNSGQSSGAKTTGDSTFRPSIKAASHTHSSTIHDSSSSSGPKTTAQLICDRFSKQVVPLKKQT